MVSEIKTNFFGYWLTFYKDLYLFSVLVWKPEMRFECLDNSLLS